MKIYGGIYFDDRGLSSSIRGMQVQTELLGVLNNNINGFNKVGFQRKNPVVSSFAEFVGVHGLSNVKDEKVGRISKTSNPLDFALGKIGYFQLQTPNGVKLSRDGRFKINKEGYLLSLENFKVMGNDGMAIKFDKLPESLEHIKVDVDGKIKVCNKKNSKVEDIGAFSVVSSNGDVLADIDVRQKHVEHSNVALHEEFFNLVPVKRNFEANRQMYLIQNDALSRIISELGRA